MPYQDCANKQSSFIDTIDMDDINEYIDKFNYTMNKRSWFESFFESAVTNLSLFGISYIVFITVFQKEN